MPFNVPCKVTNEDIVVQMQLAHTELLPLGEIIHRVKQLARDLVAQWCKAQQQQRLNQLVGPRWQHHNDAEKALACPSCGSTAVRRKCWRERTLTVDALGSVRVPRRQLQCCDCGGCWMPFARALRLPKGPYGPGMLAQGLDRALEGSYQKAAQSSRQGPSASTLHRLVSRCQPGERSAAQAAGTVVIDGTQVPAWRRSGQISVSLAQQIGPAGSPSGPRPRYTLAVAAGREVDLVKPLRRMHIGSLMHDGNLQVRGVADYVGRCYWHVPHTVRHLLYRDQIRGDDNKRRLRGLRHALQAMVHSGARLKRRLHDWIKANQDARIACRHVRGSLEGLQTLADYPEQFTVRTTSHLEREMVEINKRFENGGGWTREGAKKLLWLHQLHRHEPRQYEHVKRTLINQKVFSH